MHAIHALLFFSHFLSTENFIRVNLSLFCFLSSFSSPFICYIIIQSGAICSRNASRSLRLFYNMVCLFVCFFCVLLPRWSRQCDKIMLFLLFDFLFDSGSFSFLTCILYIYQNVLKFRTMPLCHTMYMYVLKW